MPKKKDLEQEFKKEMEKEKAKIKKQDEIQKRIGMTHKVTAWIHPRAGIDKCVDVYFKDRPDDREIQAFFKKRGSEVLTDYQIFEL